MCVCTGSMFVAPGGTYNGYIPYQSGYGRSSCCKRNILCVENVFVAAGAYLCFEYREAGIHRSRVPDG